MRREPKPVLGQHWLPHGPSLAAMVAAAELAPGEIVLEIGAGPGYLTDELLKTGATVVSLEYDRGVFERLRLKYGAQPPPNLQLIRGISVVSTGRRWDPCSKSAPTSLII